MHRICLLAGDPGLPLACVVPRDRLAALRCRASACYDGLNVDGTDANTTCVPRPTEFQRHRLQLLLDILDLAVTPGVKSLTTHELALRRIYPGMTVGRGAEWKSSSHRRRTQRLIAEARAMMNGGYRMLLAGAEGRQKQPLLSAAPAPSSFPP
nr:DUF2285 domain-containing protein [Blastomonas sp. RAC04]